MRIFSVFPAQTWVLFTCDLLLCTGLYAGCLSLAGGAAAADLSDSRGWLRILLAAFSVIIGIYFNELYVRQRVSSRVGLVLQLFHVLGLSLVLQTVVAFLFPPAGLPRRVVLFATVVGFPVLFFWRISYSTFLWKLIGSQSVLLVGSGSFARAIAVGILERPERGIRLLGYVGDPVSEELLPGAYLGPSEQLPTIVSECRPDRVVVARADQAGGELPLDELLILRRAGTNIEGGSRVYELLHSRICSSEFRPEQYIFDQTLVHRPGSLALQSVYINLMALAGIVVLSPILAILAVLVKLSTGGPVLDSVDCIGYRGIPFMMLRFRVHKTVRGSNRVFLTRLGRFLRHTHLEELPALFNLLRGEMALVGPRPDRVEYSRILDDMIPFYSQRNSLKPGLTGWSQINLDPKDNPPDAVASLEYDLYYLKNMSLTLDAYVLLHQLRQILSFAS